MSKLDKRAAIKAAAVLLGIFAWFAVFIWLLATDRLTWALILFAGSVLIPAVVIAARDLYESFKD